MCAVVDGSIVFALRGVDKGHATAVLRADKLNWGLYEPSAFARLATTYGVDAVVLEKLKEDQPWQRLIQSPHKSMQLVETVHMNSTLPRLNQGSIFIYRLAGASAKPVSNMEFPVWSTGKTLKLDLRPQW